MHVVYVRFSMEMERLSFSCVCMTSVPSPPVCLSACACTSFFLPQKRRSCEREDKGRTRWYHKRRKTPEWVRPWDYQERSYSSTDRKKERVKSGHEEKEIKKKEENILSLSRRKVSSFHTSVETNTSSPEASHLIDLSIYLALSLKSFVFPRRRLSACVSRPSSLSSFKSLFILSSFRRFLSSCSLLSSLCCINPVCKISFFCSLFFESLPPFSKPTSHSFHVEWRIRVFLYLIFFALFCTHRLLLHQVYIHSKAEAELWVSLSQSTRNSHHTEEETLSSFLPGSVSLLPRLLSTCMWYITAAKVLPIFLYHLILHRYSRDHHNKIDTQLYECLVIFECTYTPTTPRDAVSSLLTTSGFLTISFCLFRSFFFSSVPTSNLGDSVHVRFSLLVLPLSFSSSRSPSLLFFLFSIQLYLSLYLLSIVSVRVPFFFSSPFLHLWYTSKDIDLIHEEKKLLTPLS